MESSNILIRPAELNDLKAIINILQNISKYYPEEGDIEKIWKSFISQKNIFPIVAVDNKKVIGFSNLLIERNIRGGILAHIGDVSVDSAYQGKGIGYLLMDHLKNLAKDLYCYKIVLSCDDKSLGFYKKLGFTSISNSVSYFIDD